MLSNGLRLSRVIGGKCPIFRINHTLRPKLKHAAANALRIDIGRNFCTTKDEKGSQKDELKSSSHEPQNESTQSTQPPKTPADQPTVKKAEGHTNTLGSAVHNIASTLHFTQQMYETLEKRVMQGVHQKNQQRFRAMLLSVVVLFAWITVVFGTRIRKYFTDQTAGLAKETLENESLKIQTQELATAVVQTILEDKDITSHAATFLKEASTAPETQQALLKLTMHILQHKDTLDEVTNIAQKLIKNLANDKDTIAELALLFEKVLADPCLRAALIHLVGELCQDKEVLTAVSGLVVNLAGEQKVTKATSDLLTGSVSDIMQDEDISQQSRQFIADVVGDDLLQKEGGHALWKSINYALKPGIIRVTGVTLVVASVAFAKLMLSPY